MTSRLTSRRAAMAFLIVVAACLVGWLGCSKPADVWQNQPGPPRVVVSIPPLYSFVKQVGGKHVGVICLCTQTGPHHYQATSSDALALRQANLLLGIGLDLGDEKFMEQARVDSGNSKVKFVKLGESARLKDHIKKLEGGRDPHVWLGIETAKELVHEIADQLAAVDDAHAAEYQENAKAYCKKLDELQHEYRAKLKAKKDRKILPMHDALQYFKDSFDLDIEEAIELTPGDKPTSARYLELLKKCKEENIRVIATEPQYEEKEAEMLKGELKKKGIDAVLIEIDPLETAKPNELNDDWYETKMRRNLDALVEELK